MIIFQIRLYPLRFIPTRYGLILIDIVNDWQLFHFFTFNPMLIKS